jgi:hypothetical protein
MPTLTSAQWRTITVTVSAICAFLLIQNDVALEGWAKLIVGAISVGVAAIINPPQPSKVE